MQNVNNFNKQNPIEPIIGNKSINQHNYVELSANLKIAEYKYSPEKHNLLFAQNSLRISSNQNNSSNNSSKILLPTRKQPLLVVYSMQQRTLRFTDTLNKVFSKTLLAILTGKDAILKEVRDCVLRDDPDRLKEFSPYIFSYWRDLIVKHGCLCLDERIAIPKAIKDAVLEDIHSTHPGSFAMLSLAQNVWWPYIHWVILAEASECKACTEIGKNLNLVMPHCKWTPLPKCIEPNDEIQIDFCGQIINEKGIEQFFITSVDRYSKYPTAEIVNNAFGANVIKFLNNYIYNHGVCKTLRLDQARCFTGKKFETFCTENNITHIYAPANDHRAIRLVERLIQTIKRQLSCMKTQLNKKFN